RLAKTAVLRLRTDDLLRAAQAARPTLVGDRAVAGGELDCGAAGAGEADRDGDELAVAVALHGEVQVRPGAVAGVAGVGDSLPARHPLAGHDADRVPVQVRV